MTDREIEVLAKLPHIEIVVLHHVGTTSGGFLLSTRFKKLKRVTFRDCADLVTDTLHACKDVKPEMELYNCPPGFDHEHEVV